MEKYLLGNILALFGGVGVKNYFVITYGILLVLILFTTAYASEMGFLSMIQRSDNSEPFEDYLESHGDVIPLPKNEYQVVDDLGLTPPVVTIIFPNGGEIAFETIEIIVNVGNSNNEIKFIDFYYISQSGAYTYIGKDTDASDGWSLLWNTTTVPEGLYKIHVKSMGRNELEYVDSSDDYFEVRNDIAPLPEYDLKTSTPQ